MDVFGKTRSMKDEFGFFSQRINGINDEVVGFKFKRRCGRGIVNLLKSYDVGIGIDFKQPVAQGIDFDLTYCLRSSHRLAIAVGDTHSIRIDNGQMTNTAANQTFRAPRTDSSYSKYNDTSLGNALHCRGSK